MSSLLIIIGACLCAGFAAGAFVGMVYEQIQRRVALRQTELHLAVRRYLDADATVTTKRATTAEWKAFSAAHHRLAEIVGWERSAPSSSGVFRRDRTAAVDADTVVQEHRAC
ncbi:hypothetical protein [Sorangium sp. So ce388]|uniref:hypothetical protein n=1 Tax=Sorangium sp. So ce388 TaxID=3133309 RepID=UPI003F5BFC6F